MLTQTRLACMLVLALLRMQVLASCFYLLLRTLRPELLPSREDIVQQDIAAEIAALQVSTTKDLLVVHTHRLRYYTIADICATMLETLSVLYAFKCM
jgi:hypothetical protein